MIQLYICCILPLFFCRETSEYQSRQIRQIDTNIPNKPRNLTVIDIYPDSIRLSWLEAEGTNDAIVGYRLYYVSENLTRVQVIYSQQSNEPTVVYYNVTNLNPNTEYKIFVKAFTLKSESDQSNSIRNKTDIGGPSAPNILNLTCQIHDSILIKWERSVVYFYSIDYYNLYIATSESFNDNPIVLSAETEHLTTSYAVNNLTANVEYYIRISASTRSNYTGKIIQGPISEPRHFFLKHDCESITNPADLIGHHISIGMFTGVILASLSFVLTLISFAMWRKCFRTSYYYLDDPKCSMANATLDWNLPPDSDDAEHKGAIPINMFSKHVMELHADGDCGFSKEYEAIQNDVNAQNYLSNISQLTDNKAKNRYLNITAYDHSRVQLLQMPGQKKNDYINANYIDGFQLSKAYIGTQGPLPSTFDCFWRMIWEQRVAIIVMITNLVERGRRKCDMYWPKEGTETYGVIEVKLVKEDVMSTYTVRTLQIKHLRIKKKKASMAEKLVYQYHYTNWPDHGTPDHPLPVLYFVQKSAAANPSGAGPIVVHCSAGVGRTGTYIVLDAMLRQIRHRNEVNIFGFLRHIRSQRNFLVQTEEQYIFIHDVLLEAINSGETNIGREQFPKYVQILQDQSLSDTHKQCKSLDYQFKLVTNFQCRDFDLVSANKVINQPKNRKIDMLPVESSRVHLTPKPGEDGSDYINATWIQGFHSLREFIITQHPLQDTVKDFWQMIWDHNIQTIVVLSIIDNQDFGIFWPTEQNTIDADYFKVKLMNEQTQFTYIIRDFTMQSLQGDYELHVRMVYSSNWPQQCTSIADIYHLVYTVQTSHVDCHNGPILIVDRYGGTESATFCSLSTLRKHLMYDNHLDVYMYAKLYHNRRPGIWTGVQDYLRLHLAAQTLCCIAQQEYDGAMSDSNNVSNGDVPNANRSIIKIDDELNVPKSTECVEECESQEILS